MKAAVYDQNGPPEVLRYSDAPDPEIGSGDILIHVEAVSLEGGDVINRRSSPPAHPAYIVGYAAAGTVVAIGNEVTNRKIGDRVTSWGLSGSHAQLRAVSAQQTWILPARADIAEAAAIPIGFGTAHHCLFARGRLSSGSTVLVQGAAGGVGIAAVQLAHQAGATVIAVASGENRARGLIELGASSVIDHNRESVADVVRDLTNNRGVDLVVDPVGATLATSLAALRDEGSLVSVGNAGGGSLTVDLWQALQRNQSILGVFMGTVLSRPEVRRTVDTMLADLSQGRLTVPIDRRFPLAQAAAAHRHAEDNKILGRILLIP
ncbi:zinc-binding alcohol dehydrogenase family protein [Bradyrhizobium sp. Leo121]|uniref:quinone oxidoreductase family protein n=1 Tax=Bradyrhizobium sp. Leo121 TaxID=1571195 RepID=UPI0010298D16|nr:zinc-binding alcohol dehydrogenase family protein [Bradyrhizobium sp. Leo121]RZN33230.1 NADP-dependent oxidoreductase [Bradyrhizobium sp. Leo121]